VTQVLSLKCPGVIGGGIESTYRDPTAPPIFQPFDAAVAFRQDIYITDQHFAGTANMFVSREVLERVGPFNSRLKSNGNWEWGSKISQNNIPQRFGNDVVVKHPPK